MGFVAAVPTLVFWVFQHVPDRQHIEGVSLPAGVSHLQQLLGYLPGAISVVGIQIKYDPHDFRFFLIDGQHTILFVITVELVVAQHMAILNRLPETKFQSLGKLSHLILGNARHDDQTKLAVGIQGVDVVILEEHAHIVLQQLLGVLDAVQGGAGKTGDFLGDDKVKQPRLGIPDHTIEIISPLGAGAGDALIDVPRHKGPVGFALDQLGVILHLVFQGVQLFILICRNTGVKGYP